MPLNSDEFAGLLDNLEDTDEFGEASYVRVYADSAIGGGAKPDWDQAVDHVKRELEQDYTIEEIGFGVDEDRKHKRRYYELKVHDAFPEEVYRLFKNKEDVGVDAGYTPGEYIVHIAVYTDWEEATSEDPYRYRG